MQKTLEFSKLLDSREFATWSGAKFMCLKDQEDCLHTCEQGNALY